MTHEQTFNENRYDNGLVKSPRNAKSVKKTSLSDCVITTPFHCSNRSMEEIVFTRIMFCDNFSLNDIKDNKVIILENCVFQKNAELSHIKNSRIIIRNCRFNELLHITDAESGMIELYGTSHYKDAYLDNIKTDMLFTSDVSMKKQNMLQMTNSNISNYLNH
jgi:hypothetical protein